MGLISTYEELIKRYSKDMVNFDHEIDRYRLALESLNKKNADMDPEQQISEWNLLNKKIFSGDNWNADWSSGKCVRTKKSLLTGILLYGWIIHGEYAKQKGISGWWAKTKYAEIHQCLYLWFLSDERLGALAYPRKFGKTTSEKIFISWLFSTVYFKYVVWVGDTDENIIYHISNVKEALVKNDLRNQIFGQLIDQTSIWKESEVTTLQGFHLITKSKRSPFRGLLDDSPPDLIIADDIDNDDEKYSLVLRDKLDEKLQTSLYNVGLPNGKVRHVGTILYKDCILDRRLQGHAVWDCILLSCWKDNKASDEKKLSIAESVLSKDILFQIREDLFNAKPIPKPHIWFAEHENNPIDESIRKFKASFLARYKGFYSNGFLVMADGRKLAVRVTTAVDLASAQGSKKSDFSVIMTVATDKDYNLYILRLWRKLNCKPSEVVEEIYNHYIDYGTKEVHIEMIGMQDSLMETWENKGRTVSMMPQLHAIRNRRISKEDRLKGAIITKLEAGKIFYHEDDKNIRDLIEEMDNYGGTGSHDDILDTLADNIVFSVSPVEQNQVAEPFANRPLALRPNKEVESKANWFF
jgi:hypothetical protein